MKSVADSSVIAASTWRQYDPFDILIPEGGEWCLWSIVIDEVRHYGYGSLRINQTLLFIEQGIGKFIKVNDDTFYWAQINKKVI